MPRYDEAFKRNAVEAALNGDKSVTAVAAELGVARSTLAGWIRHAQTTRWPEQVAPAAAIDAPSADAPEVNPAPDANNAAATPHDDASSADTVTVDDGAAGETASADVTSGTIDSATDAPTASAELAASSGVEPSVTHDGSDASSAASASATSTDLPKVDEPLAFIDHRSPASPAAATGDSAATPRVAKPRRAPGKARQRFSAAALTALAIAAITAIAFFAIAPRGGDAAGAQPLTLTSAASTAAYSQAADDLDAAYLDARDEYCALATDVVAAVATFDRAALETVPNLEIIAATQTVIPDEVRAPVAAQREALVEALVAAAPSPAQRQLHTLFGAYAFPSAACLERTPAPTVDRLASPLAEDVAALEARIGEVALVTDRADLERLQGAVQALAGSHAVITEAATGRLPVWEIRYWAPSPTDAQFDQLDQIDARVEQAVTVPAGALPAADLALAVADYAVAGSMLLETPVTTSGITVTELPSVVRPALPMDPRMAAALAPVPTTVGAGTVPAVAQPDAAPEPGSSANGPEPSETTPPTPGPSEPGPSDPGPSNPGPSDPGPTDPGPTDPGPTDPGPTDPGPTDPGPTDPGPTDPGPTDPEPTDPDPGPVDPPAPVEPDEPELCLLVICIDL